MPSKIARSCRPSCACNERSIMPAAWLSRPCARCISGLVSISASGSAQPARLLAGGWRTCRPPPPSPSPLIWASPGSAGPVKPFFPFMFPPRSEALRALESSKQKTLGQRLGSVPGTQVPVVAFWCRLHSYGDAEPAGQALGGSKSREGIGYDLGGKGGGASALPETFCAFPHRKPKERRCLRCLHLGGYSCRSGHFPARISGTDRAFRSEERRV